MNRYLKIEWRRTGRFRTWTSLGKPRGKIDRFSAVHAAQTAARRLVVASVPIEARVVEMPGHKVITTFVGVAR